MTNAERQKRHRQRLRDKGMTSRNYWATPEEHALVKQYLNKIRIKDEAGAVQQPADHVATANSRG